MKKTWIKFKREYLEPEQREKLGIRIWLYLHILDRADWETGKIFDWRDKLEAEDFGMQWRTLQQQRQQLENDGFISCLQSGDHQVITIHNWTNPREYSGELHNPYGEGTESRVPQQMGGAIEGTYEGTREGSRKPSTHTYDSQITDHMSEDTTTGSLSPLSAAFVNETQIPELTGGPQKWSEALRDLKKAGVEPQDIVNAVIEMRDKGLMITTLRSVVNPSIYAMSKRKSKWNGKQKGAPDYSAYTDDTEYDPEEAGMIREKILAEEAEAAKRKAEKDAYLREKYPDRFGPHAPRD